MIIIFLFRHDGQLVLILSIIFSFMILCVLLIDLFVYGTVIIDDDKFVYKKLFSQKLVKKIDIKSCELCYFVNDNSFRMKYSINIKTFENNNFLFCIDGNSRLLNDLIAFVPKKTIKLNNIPNRHKINKSYYNILKEYLNEQQMKKFISK